VPGHCQLAFSFGSGTLFLNRSMVEISFHFVSDELLKRCSLAMPWANSRKRIMQIKGETKEIHGEMNRLMSLAL